MTNLPKPTTKTNSTTNDHNPISGRPYSNGAIKLKVDWGITYFNISVKSGIFPVHFSMARIIRLTSKEKSYLM